MGYTRADPSFCSPLTPQFTLPVAVFLVHQITALRAFSLSTFFPSILGSFPAISISSSQIRFLPPAPCPWALHLQLQPSVPSSLPLSLSQRPPRRHSPFPVAAFLPLWLPDPCKILSHVQPALQNATCLTLASSLVDCAFPFCLFHVYLRKEWYERHVSAVGKSRLLRINWTCQ